MRGIYLVCFLFGFGPLGPILGMVRTTSWICSIVACAQLLLLAATVCKA